LPGYSSVIYAVADWPHDAWRIRKITTFYYIWLKIYSRKMFSNVPNIY
jgi:hypothetical protein